MAYRTCVARLQTHKTWIDDADVNGIMQGNATSFTPVPLAHKSSLLFNDTCSVKPKFHYADFPVTSVTNP